MRWLALLLAMLSAPAMAADKLTVMLDWYTNPVHGPLVVAREKGFFAAHDLEVELIQPADPSDGPKLAAARQVDIALDYQPQLQMQVDAGLPLVRIGTMIGTPLNIIVALEESGIRTAADLKGKRIGYSVTGFEDSILDAVLGKVGLGRADVELINVNFNLTPALLAGQVDAVVGAYRNYELIQLAEQGKRGVAIYPEEAGIPVYDEITFVAHSGSLDRPELKRFIAAIQDTTLWIKNHPDEAWDAFRRSDKALDDELNAKSWAQTWPRYSDAPGALDHARYEAFARFLHEHGLIKAIRPIGEYAVDLWARR